MTQLVPSMPREVLCPVLLTLDLSVSLRFILRLVVVEERTMSTRCRGVFGRRPARGDLAEQWYRLIRSYRHAARLSGWISYGSLLSIYTVAFL